MKALRATGTLTRGMVWAAGLLLVAAPSVFAADHALTPVTEVKDAKPIGQWATFVLMILVCIVVAFKNPKRSHQN